MSSRVVLQPRWVLLMAVRACVRACMCLPCACGGGAVDGMRVSEHTDARTLVRGSQESQRSQGQSP